MQKRRFNTIIIGGGASGLFLASHLKSEFIILENSRTCGNKLAISGGGKCNFTNLDLSLNNYTGNAELALSAIKKLKPKQLCNFIEKLGLGYEIRKQNQAFLKCSAKEFVLKLEFLIDKKSIINDCKVLDVEFASGEFCIDSTMGQFYCKNLVIASGGLSYGALGVSDIAYKVAKKFGHKVIEPSPALVGFTLQPSENWFKTLSGVSLEVALRIGNKTIKNDLLFTHKGVSGPAVLSASVYRENGFIEIDFLPNFSMQNLNTQKLISTAIPAPKSFVKAFLQNFNIQDISCNKLSAQDKEKLALLKCYKFAPAGTFGYSKAEITKGGVEDVDENSFESKHIKGLYFIGEALNVNGELGGYNLHFAFASALICADVLK